MKALNLHATQTKKSYKKPVLKKIGTVKSLTKGEKPGSGDLGQGSQV
jgi:hypothetical protein